MTNIYTIGTSYVFDVNTNTGYIIKDNRLNKIFEIVGNTTIKLTSVPVGVIRKAYNIIGGQFKWQR